MELWIGILILLAVIFVWFLRKFGSPQATAQTLLREYEAFERSGLPEDEGLFQMLAARGGWRALPGPFLLELTKRLVSKENLIAFVILAERYRLLESDLVRIASSAGSGREGVSLAVDKVAVVLIDLHNRLSERAVLGPEFVRVGGVLRRMPKWAVKIEGLFDRVETAMSYQSPQDSDLVFQLAHHIGQRQAEDA